MVQNERLKKIRNIGIIVLLVIASYVGVFAAGYDRGIKSGYSGATEQSDKVEAGIQRAGGDSKEVVKGINSLEKGLKDLSVQVTSTQEEISESREESELISEVANRIEERSSTIERQSSKLIDGSGSIDSGFSDIEEKLSEMLNQD